MVSSQQRCYPLLLLTSDAGVTPPHECLVMPELYLHYSSVFLYGNKSLVFKLFSDQIVTNEAEAKEKLKKKGED